MAGVDVQHQTHEQDDYERSLAALRSPDAGVWAAAAIDLAFGDVTLPPAAAGRLEELLTHASAEKELAVLLTVLERTVMTNSGVELTDVECVRRFAGHADARVASAARGVLSAIGDTVSGGMQPSPNPVGLDALVLPAGGTDSLVPLKPLPAATGSKSEPKRGRPSQTVRRLDTEHLLNDVLPRLQAELDGLHRPVADRFNELLTHLAGEAAETSEHNHRLAGAVTQLARRYGIDLMYEKEGELNAVTIRWASAGNRTGGRFHIRSRRGAHSLTSSVTWPPLTAAPTKAEKGEED